MRKTIMILALAMIVLASAGFASAWNPFSGNTNSITGNVVAEDCGLFETFCEYNGGKCILWWESCSCTPKTSCDNGQQCGTQSDGCDGTISCGTCSEGYKCNGASCYLPQCYNKNCGDDGGGGSCGECGEKQYCDYDATCQTAYTCTSNCVGKQCGDDGCQGSCGTCWGMDVCNSQGQCETPCSPKTSCDNNQLCGTQDNGCGTGTINCGTCQEGEICNSGKCEVKKDSCGCWWPTSCCANENNACKAPWQSCSTCSDGIKNGEELEVDCGGSYCAPCPSCADGIQNQDEAGIDCGGEACGNSCCGNGVVDNYLNGSEYEECDGAKLRDKGCGNFGYTEGTLKCSQWCTFDTSGCGNGGGGGECGSGLFRCDNVGCVDLSSDTYNCGTCGKVCNSGEWCERGRCISCNGEEFACFFGDYPGRNFCSCDGSCYDLDNDASNCGGCANQCPQGGYCAFGGCLCPSGLTACTTTNAEEWEAECVDTLTNNNFCGKTGCGRKCGEREYCTDGECKKALCENPNSVSSNAVASAVRGVMASFASFSNNVFGTSFSAADTSSSSQEDCGCPNGGTPPDCIVPQCTDIDGNMVDIGAVKTGSETYCDGTSDVKSQEVCTAGSGGPTWEVQTVSDCVRTGCAKEPKDCESSSTETCTTGDGKSGTKTCGIDCTWGDCVADNNNQCTNGATNYPACDNNQCTNGATNPPACDNKCDIGGGGGGGGRAVQPPTNGPGVNNPINLGARVSNAISGLWNSFVNIGLGKDTITGKPYTLGRASSDILGPNWQVFNNGFVYPLFNTAGMLVGYGPFVPSYYYGYGADWEGLKQQHEAYVMSTKESQQGDLGAILYGLGAGQLAPEIGMGLKALGSGYQTYLKPLATIIKSKLISAATTSVAKAPTAFAPAANEALAAISGNDVAKLRGLISEANPGKTVASVVKDPSIIPGSGNVEKYVAKFTDGTEMPFYVKPGVNPVEVEMSKRAAELEVSPGVVVVNSPEGQTLVTAGARGNSLADSALTLSQKKEAMKKLGEAVKKLNEFHIEHGDIMLPSGTELNKGNIFFHMEKGQGQVQLIDWGLAKNGVNDVAGIRNAIGNSYSQFEASALQAAFDEGYNLGNLRPFNMEFSIDIVKPNQIPVYVGGTYGDRSVMMTAKELTEGMVKAAADNPNLFDTEALKNIYRRGIAADKYNPELWGSLRKVSKELNKRFNVAKPAAVNSPGPTMQLTESQLQTKLTRDDLGRLWRANVDRMVKAGKSEMDLYYQVGKELEDAMRKVRRGETVRVKDLPKSLNSLQTGQLSPVVSTGADLAANYERQMSRNKEVGLNPSDIQGLGIPRPVDAFGEKIPFGNKFHIEAESTDQIREILNRIQSTMTDNPKFKDLYLKVGTGKRLANSNPEGALETAKYQLKGLEGTPEYPNLLAKDWYYTMNQGEGKALTIYIPESYPDAQVVELANQLKQDLHGYNGINSGSKGIPSEFPAEFTQAQIDYIKNILAEKGPPQYYPFSDANIISARFGGETWKGNYNWPYLGNSPYPRGTSNPFVNVPAKPANLKNFIQQMKEAKAKEIQSLGTKGPSEWAGSNDPVVMQLKNEWTFEGTQNAGTSDVGDLWVFTKVNRDANGNVLPEFPTFAVPKGASPSETSSILNQKWNRFQLDKVIPSIPVPEGASPALTKSYTELNTIIDNLKNQQGGVGDISSLNGLYTQTRDSLSGLSVSEMQAIGKDIYDIKIKFRKMGWVVDSTTGKYSRQLPVIDGAPDLVIGYDTMDAGALDFAFLNIVDSTGSLNFRAKNVLNDLSPDKRVSLTMNTVGKALKELQQNVNIQQISYIPSGYTDREMWGRALLYYREFDEAGFVLASYSKMEPQRGRWVWRKATSDDFGSDGKIKQIISIRDMLQLVPPKNVPISP